MTGHRTELEAMDAEQALIHAQFAPGAPIPELGDAADLTAWRVAASLGSLDAEAAAVREPEAEYEAEAAS